MIVNSGGSIGANVYGGRSEDLIGSSPVTATNNSVTINPGGTKATTGYHIYGGYALTSLYEARATNNHVIINGGTVQGGSIYGGFADASTTNARTIATGNSVTIKGSPTLNGVYGLYGGVGTGDGMGDTFSGNTLNLHSPITVQEMANFQNLNFYLPATLGAGGTMLTVTGNASLVSATDGTQSTVNVGIDGRGSPLAVNDTVTLINAGTMTGGVTNSTANGAGMQGVTLKYEFDITADTAAGLLTATVTKADTSQQAKALSEGFLAEMILLNQAGDLVAGAGTAHAVSATQGAAGGNGLRGFAAFSGGWSRYDTGSYVDMSSLSMMTGVAYGVDTTPGHLTLGAFFEFGSGTYDTYNSFSNAASVDGAGDAYYAGGGILGRMDFQNTGPGRFYTEASARIGRIHGEYDNSGLMDGMGRMAGYDSSSLYYGLHFGTGYLWNVTEKISIDLYGKYFWTRLEGDSVTLSTGDPVDFQAVDSNRLRFGSRFSYAVSEYVSPYIGAAYEHEFDGEARATAYGYAIDAPDLEGGTGIGEIGLTLKPSQTQPLSFDLGLRGYTGVREGVAGSLQVKFEF
ncbi:MAG: autotransporter outer membrane beta-barrel domain-containing protein [Azoarcus sp.]|nr:autotransporter outer membrane beta-barrel domain-containing protein [Azoarcus sp.]